MTYSGEEKYMFISYGHRDSSDVMKAIDAFKKRGVRIWYDKGISPGEDWSLSIGKALENSSCVMFFASKASVKSENVNREIKFAKEHGIPVVTVKLGDFRMPPALEHMLMVNQFANLSAFKTYGEFADEMLQVLKPFGICTGSNNSPKEGTEVQDPSDIDNEKIMLSSRKKAEKRIITICSVATVIILAGLICYLLLFKEIPKVVNLPSEQAKETVEEAGFDCNVSLNYSSEYEYGIIFSQSASGINFRFIPVVLVQSLGPEENLTNVPDTVGKHISDGARLLVDAGMKKFIITPDDHGTKEISHIERQSIPAGLRVSADNVIGLDVVSDGGDIVFELNGVLYIISGTEPTEINADDPSDLTVFTETESEDGNDDEGKNSLTVTSTPTPEPTSPPIPTNTTVPTDTPTPEPSNTPVPTNTPMPTNTPVPTYTPTPTNTPAPTNTPTPTSTPTPTNTPTPASTPTPEPARFDSLGGGKYLVYNMAGLKAVHDIPMTAEEANALGDEWFDGENVADSYSTEITIMEDFSVTEPYDGLWNIIVPEGVTLTIKDKGEIQCCAVIESRGNVIVKNGGRFYCTMGGEECIKNYGTVTVEEGAVLQSMFGGTFNNMSGGKLILNGTFNCGAIYYDGMTHIWFTNNGSVTGSGTAVIYNAGKDSVNNLDNPLDFEATAASLEGIIKNDAVKVTFDKELCP